jgi:two-component system chemotaxis response regulator CheB
MPPRFTTTFAERLNQKSRLRVKEVIGMDPLRPGWAYIAPGHACLEVGRSDGELNVMAVPPDGTERYVPSADRLFSSVAFSAGKQALGIVLTGMGDDGSRGAVDLAANGAAIVVEDKSTTVVDGMPSATLATGTVTRVAALPRMAGIITKFAASK